MLGSVAFLWYSLLYLLGGCKMTEYVVMVGLGFLIGMIVTMGLM